METSNRRMVWLYFIAVSAWVVLYLIANNKADWDLWGVMSFGALLDQNPHFFPYHDVFSYTAFGRPWIYHEWGSGVIFFQLFKHFGSGSLFLLKLLLVECIFGLSCQSIFKKNNPAMSLSNWLLALCLPVAAYLILPIVATTIRCQLFTFLAYALFLMILERHKQNAASWGIWMLPFLMMAWVNVHGGFITGLVVIGSYLLHYWLQKESRPAMQLAVVFVLSSLATLVNPYGLTFLRTMVSAWSLPRTEISEWGNVFMLPIPAYGVLYTLLLLAAISIGVWQWRRDYKRFSGPVLLLLFSGWYGWLHYKLAPLFLITLLSIGFQFIPACLPGEKLMKQPLMRGLGKIVAYVVPVLLALVGVGVTALFVQTHPKPWLVQVQGAETVREDSVVTKFAYPLGVVDFLRDNQIHAALWVPFSWGEFLYWNLYPNVHVSVDGRYETIYPQSVFNAYYSFYHPPYQISNATEFSSTHVLIPRRRAELIARFNHNANWRLMYQDALSLLYVRAGRQPVPPRSYSSVSRPMDDFMGDLSRFRLLR